MLTCLFVLACQCPALAMGGPDDQQVSGKLTLDKAAHKAGETAKAMITLEIAKGFHLNADADQGPAGMPMQLVLEGDEALTLGLVSYPKARLAKLAFAEKKAAVFEDTIELTAEIVIAADAAKGPRKAELVLTYQGCNDQMCFMPVDLVLPVTVLVD
ncbi:protein-disulfide reductase DsbD domain-containing protein [Desulfarculus baarsii]|uniref:protein-disulfide reductase DsbD domain-containing protein n=1 Tax=Desulfarculus baarsii TaxID=453230 RepID=UPI001650F6A5|nr:protein-disulfide reductase DsbD domain-containing protein [Desulfarculus baarsii]